MKYFITLFFLCSCTISFQNIDTHGTSKDLIKEELENSPKIDPSLDVPLIK